MKKEEINNIAHEYVINETKRSLQLVRVPDVFEMKMKLFSAEELESAFKSGVKCALKEASSLERKEDIMKSSADDCQKSNMPFGDAIEVLKQGGVVQRKGWNGKNIYVFKQVPAHIGSGIIPKMQSLPKAAKDLIMEEKGYIEYTSQCLIYNKDTGRADSWTPSISDVFAEDWEIVR